MTMKMVEDLDPEREEEVEGLVIEMIPVVDLEIEREKDLVTQMILVVGLKVEEDLVQEKEEEEVRK